MDKKLILILSALGCGSLFFFMVIVGGGAYYIYQNVQQLNKDVFEGNFDDYDYELVNAHANAYTEVAAHYLGDRMKAAHPDHKVLLFCAVEPATERDDLWVDVDMRKAIQSGLAKAYGPDAVTTVFVDVQPLTEADYESEDYGYYFEYKVSPAAYTAAMDQADTNTLCIWHLPLPTNFRTQPQVVQPPEASPVFTLFQVDTVGLNDLIASGHIAVAVDFNVSEDLDYEDELPADRDTAFNAAYYYIDAETLPGILEDVPDYFKSY